MAQTRSHSPLKISVAVAMPAIAFLILCWTSQAQDAGSGKGELQEKITSVEKRFGQQIQPLLKKFCTRCHNAKEMESGIRVDHLIGTPQDRQLRLWKGIRKLLAEKAMPPEGEPQPTANELRLLDQWIGDLLTVALTRKQEKNGTIRRLTVSQYRNTLRDLLGLEEDLTEVLPPDGVSKDGFLNNGQTLQLSPLLVESYFEIAEKALDRCIVDKKTKPAIQNFRMDLGAAINPEPCKDNLILGALSRLLKNDDFRVTQLNPAKPFDYKPFRMRTKYEFIEGYRGNATVRGWKKYDSIYHSVFACVRGTDGYPKGRAYEAITDGLLLRPAIPSAEIFKQSSTYGPRANFKISLRELPDHGRFRVTVKAAKYDDALLLDASTAVPAEPNKEAITVKDLLKPQTVEIKKAGIYQAEVYLRAASEDSMSPNASKPPPTKKRQSLSLKLGDRHFSGTLNQTAFMAVRLPAGPLTVSAQYGGNFAPNRIVLTPIKDTHPLAKRFTTFEKRSPLLGVHLGLRRDCGSTLAQVDRPQAVSSGKLQKFIFEGAINNFPSPDVEKDNVNYLAGIREIGIRSQYTDGRDMPRLIIRSVEFEGPFYKSWPPVTHRNIFIESDNKNDPAAYAQEVIRSFATRAFRRPVTDAELASLFVVWKNSFADGADFQQSIKDALLVALTSPQFLFVIENSGTPEAEELDSYELASKLSYFLWNTAPDRRLLKLAAENNLHNSLNSETDRMIGDPRFRQFADEFVAQWLNLDKFDIVEVDRKRYPKLTRDTKTQLRDEPVHFVQYLVRQNRPLRNLIQSDFILANEVVADYYGLADRTESGFEFVPIKHKSEYLGGVLSQASILSGLSDGRESNPVKRGAWLARKIIAEPPDDPPPNVPGLPEDDGSKLTLRQKIERHRNQKGCVKCHSGIDPWGIPFEQYDAGGLLKKGQKIDAHSILPDKTKVADFRGLKAYLAEDRIDQVAFSFLKHLATYAVGRTLTYNELEFLKEEGLKLKADGYPTRDMVRFVVNSKIFLEK